MPKLKPTILIAGVKLTLRRAEPPFYSSAPTREAVPRVEAWQTHGRWNALFYGRELHLTSRHKSTLPEAIESLELRINRATMDSSWIEGGGDG